MFGRRNFTLVSLLDLLACAFGAAVLLAIIFMIANPPAEEEAFAARGFVFHLVVEGDEPLMSLVLQPPGARGKQIDLDVRQQPLGEPTTCGADSCVLYGWTQSGNEQLLERLDRPEKTREFIAVLPNPTVGQWHIAVRFFNRTKQPHDWSQALSPVIIRAASLTGLNLPEDPCANLIGREVRFGELAACEGVIEISSLD